MRKAQSNHGAAFVRQLLRAELIVRHARSKVAGEQIDFNWLSEGQ